MSSTEHERWDKIKEALEMIDALAAENARLREALTDLVEIIDAAGLLNLSNGVQLGQTSWYMKAIDRLSFARITLGGSDDR